ncbi:hypothetical protein [Frigoribacterium sp. Leaf172]|uniref:hypothetical protein n=1 Tax=Frigoribacterium sp. Leaf172 TaxID=1736285 RepID=UPI0006F56E07|nr:hypothetical protein [Frigoribacterium sp. Leaf172]KQR64706.1 hypothetical protein ASF89_09595 [Frigoribacterium sp. Leaf172]
MRPSPLRRLATVLAAASLVATVAVVAPVASAPAPAEAATVAATAHPTGSTSLKTPAAGGTTIWVSTTGRDYIDLRYPDGHVEPYKRSYCIGNAASTDWVRKQCPAANYSNPVRSLQMAMLLVQPGDVVVVRGGTYTESVSNNGKGGSASKPIVIQNAPGERAVVAGRFVFTGADHWLVWGLRFTYDAAKSNTYGLVTFAGGTGWTFRGNDVSGSRRTANVMVTTEAPSGTSTAARVAAAPHDWTVVGNVIHENKGQDVLGTDHNLYLLASIWSSNGLVERNLIWGAPRGANIKAAGSSDPNESPRDVAIRYNTLLYAGSGVTIGLKAEGVVLWRNVIGAPQGEQYNSGGIKTYRIAQPARNLAKYNYIAGYRYPYYTDPGAGQITKASNVAVTYALPLTGSVKNDTVRPANASVDRSYGRNYGQ